ncbi:siderophore-interacting protein [Thaumasiovibrio subtropicus]|uniref:siderophore-interacting protein n=1 Tax=Thaumasiovibrio subtropicus TaxID=1891207 RepID=UPI000B35A449|nr:siderophore-interacting protein [Thaumasiovibrio subtropicus]
MSNITPKAPPLVPPRMLTCVRKETISENLLRVTLTGDDLIGFPTDKKGAHIKLFFANARSGNLILPTLHEGKIVWPDQRPITRTYTVRDYRQKANEIDVDFVLHGSKSPASGWAASAKVGDKIGLAGPGGPDPLLAPADWHILAGDLTAIPAISALLETLPETAKGYAFLEVDSVKDRHCITHPPGIRVTWLTRDVTTKAGSIPAAIDQLVPLEGELSAFIGGENSAVLACRKQLIADYQLSKANLYAIPYWRRGQKEEAYHQERHKIMDEVY